MPSARARPPTNCGVRNWETRLTRLIAIAASPRTNKVHDRQPFNRLSRAWRAPCHRKISCRRRQRGRPPRKSWLRRIGTLQVFRAPGDKNGAVKDQDLVPALVDATKSVGDETPFRLGGLAFRHRLHRIRNDVALMYWVRPAHVFETWR